MKSILIATIAILGTLHIANCQTVSKPHTDTTTKCFINIAKGCTLKYISGGLDAGEVDVFCENAQFELQFIAKNDSGELYIDDYIFKNASGKTRELTTDYSVYDKFDCYAFVYPQREKQPYIDFPVMMTAYKRVMGDTWQYLTMKTVKNLKEYGNFEDQVIHKVYDNR